MKKILICILAIMISSTLIYAYNVNIKGEKLLQEYKTEKCLFDLLSSIVSSNTKFYNSKKYYYSLEFQIDHNRRSLYIAPEMFNNARTIEYSGFVNVRGMLFLCKGDYKNDSLFYRVPGTKKVSLKLSKTELGLLHSFNEPSLEGTLKLCNGLPIDISIYTKGLISGYSNK